MNSFRSLNRKQTRQFNALSSDEKTAAFAEEAKNAIRKATDRAAANGFVKGYLFFAKKMKESYITEINENNFEEMTKKMFAEILNAAERYEQQEKEQAGVAFGNAESNE